MLKYVIIFIAAAVVLLAVFQLILKILRFKDDFKYINMEIRRTDGEEKERWKRKRKKLWKSFFGIY